MIRLLAIASAFIGALAGTANAQGASRCANVDERFERCIATTCTSSWNSSDRKVTPATCMVNCQYIVQECAKVPWGYGYPQKKTK